MTANGHHHPPPREQDDHPHLTCAANALVAAIGADHLTPQLRELDTAARRAVKAANQARTAAANGTALNRAEQHHAAGSAIELVAAGLDCATAFLEIFAAAERDNIVAAQHAAGSQAGQAAAAAERIAARTATFQRDLAAGTHTTANIAQGLNPQ